MIIFGPRQQRHFLPSESSMRLRRLSVLYTKVDVLALSPSVLVFQPLTFLLHFQVSRAKTAVPPIPIMNENEKEHRIKYNHVKIFKLGVGCGGI